MRLIDVRSRRVGWWLSGALASGLIVAVAVLAWARSRTEASRESPPPSPALAVAPIDDSAIETWRVVAPPKAPAVATASQAPPAAPPASEPDWGALSAEVADAPEARAVPLAGPAEIAGHLSVSERERLIAAGDDRPTRGKRGRGTVVIGRGTPRRGGGDGTCYY